jgi:hypothetical protein
MLRYTLAVSLLLATANAGTAGNLRLRGGGPVTFSKLTKGPGMERSAHLVGKFPGLPNRISS